MESHTDMTPEDFVVLDVSDAGMGMSSEVPTHVFEPFFATKGKTGVGPSVVLDLVMRSGGHM